MWSTWIIPGADTLSLSQFRTQIRVTAVLTKMQEWGWLSQLNLVLRVDKVPSLFPRAESSVPGCSFKGFIYPFIFWCCLCVEFYDLKIEVRQDRWTVQWGFQERDAERLCSGPLRGWMCPPHDHHHIASGVCPQTQSDWEENGE